VLLCLTSTSGAPGESGNPPPGENGKRPHIVVILADDLGWKDVSWHNRQMITPRMEEISAEGVRLERSYVTPKCSPSRAALMTGYYPWRLGRQRGAIERYHQSGLNTSIKILPEYLKDAGYSTHLVGKWHLGYCHEDYLPNNRGFDTFFGQYTHVTDYYTRKVDYEKYTPEMAGYDLRDNEKVTYEGNGEFSTDLYTRKAVDVIQNHDASEPLFLYLAYQAPHKPNQMPPKKYRKYDAKSKIVKEEGMAFLSTITALDAGVGRVYDALRKAGLYENTVFIFSTDNGGSGSNFPLRGEKEELYEGGIRGVGFVNSPLLNLKSTENHGLMFITDWFSTLIELAGQSHQIPSDTDSISQWSSLSDNSTSTRNQIILNLDQDNRFNLWSAAIIQDEYKLIWGQEALLKQRSPEKTCNWELYQIYRDPYETENLVEIGRGRKFKVADLKDELMKNFRLMGKADYPNNAKEAYPSNWGGVLSPGWCEARK